MVSTIAEQQQAGTRAPAKQPRRLIAWILIAIVDASFVIWGAMAALWLPHLLGPNSKPILPAGFEGYTGGSWQQLADASPKAAGYMTLLFRTYGAYNVAFGILGVAIAVNAFRKGERWAWWALLLGNTITLGSAMTYDRLVRAIGPFEVSEYVGLALVYVALALTAPFFPAGKRVR